MRQLYDKELDYSSCGVGFITNKHSTQTHELLQHVHQALCKIPHRGGFNAEGIGDGAGVNIDLSLSFYRHLTGNEQLNPGEFGVANFFYPRDPNQHTEAEAVIHGVCKKYKLPILLWRKVPVNPDVLNKKSAAKQLPIQQIVFARPDNINEQKLFDDILHSALHEIEYAAFKEPNLQGFYPLSMSSRTQVYKGRLNSWEVVPYFEDLNDARHQIHTLFFHTRFSTNTAPKTMFAQPFRRMAHNGELNTDRKNRLSEDAIARSNGKRVVFPNGQSDSGRLDQTLARRIIEDDLAIDTAVLAMMPPAWENDSRLSPHVRDMLEYLSLYEEKNDGPAAIIFGNGKKVGARLDRLGLRPLRSVETKDYLAVMSEAGQLNFPPDSVIKRGRIEAGGMIVFDHDRKSIEYTDDVLERLAAEKDYGELLNAARIKLEELPAISITDVHLENPMQQAARHVAYGLNQESFKFMLDPMLLNGAEKISAMGYGLTPNALSNAEGGMSRYFSQRFAQVTNPPLDSIREADGMTLRVALGRKPNFSDGSTCQLVIPSPILQPQQLSQIQEQDRLTVETINTLYEPQFDAAAANEINLLDALERVCDQAEELAEKGCDAIVLSDRNIAANQAALPAILVSSAVNQRLIKQGLRFNSSLIYETGQAVSTHDIACIIGFGAAAVCPLSVYYRAQELFQEKEGIQKALNNYQKAVEKALMKTMGKFGLCTAESYIGGEFFEANFIDTEDPLLKRIFPNIHSPVGGARFKDIAINTTEWHRKAMMIQTEKDIPNLGLFKERAEGAGHSFGVTAVREFTQLTEEPIQYSDISEDNEPVHLLPQDDGYRKMGYEPCSAEQIDNFTITPAYRNFTHEIYKERAQRPAALRDVLALPIDLTVCNSESDFSKILNGISRTGNVIYSFQGLNIDHISNQEIQLALT
ncbi:MAG: glutamate synthase central domain-containing protein, partial [Pseudomonadota bacterium]